MVCVGSVVTMMCVGVFVSYSMGVVKCGVCGQCGDHDVCGCVYILQCECCEVWCVWTVWCL